MFTGITRGKFAVTHIERKPDLLSYAVALPLELIAGLARGASVAVDGVCQTATEIDAREVWFDAIHETLERTTLGELAVGRRVSIERSYKIGDELGGHDIAGHVIGKGRVERVTQRNDVCDLHIAVPQAWIKYILPKGFIAVDGSSLTIGEVAQAGFDVHLVPETLRLTNLGEKRAGDAVNIELDARTVAIVDTVERVLAARGR